MPAPTTPLQPYAALHESPNGGDDARPTAMRILEDQKLIGNWSDKVILITGGTSGIGLESARALHATGAKVFITARSQEKAEKTIQDILSTSPSKTPIEFLEMELDSLASVRAAASSFLGRSKQLNVLMLNAGIMAAPQEHTKDGFDLQFGVCHLAHFLLFELLKPTLLKSATSSFASRVTITSSSGHKAYPVNLEDPNFEHSEYNKWAAYGSAKSANVWMANEIDRRYGSQGLHAFSVHPGAISTSLGRYLDDEDRKVLSSFIPDKKIYKKPPQGAATQVWCATAKELEGKGGFYCAKCGSADPKAEDEPISGDGYAPHAYNEDGERKLWEYSIKAVGLNQD